MRADRRQPLIPRRAASRRLAVALPVRSGFSRTGLRVALAVLLSLGCVGLASAPPAAPQPSGGPYGPLHQTYAVPTAAHVYYVAPDGKADASGSALSEPTTIEAAIGRVVTGDAIVLRGGVYRTGGLVLNQGITMQPYADEHPVFKGTRVATKWEALRDNVWQTFWPTLFPMKPADWWRRNREGTRTPLHRFNNDMVFVDGEMLQSAGWEGEVDEHSYAIDYESGHVFIGVDPAQHVVEITAFDSAIVRTTGPCHGKVSDRKGPVIRGITFTQYAYRAFEIEGKEPDGPADPATFGKEVVGTTLENVTISYCSRVAGYFHGDGLTIRHCLISDTSTEGIYIIDSADCLLERNIFRRNNVERITGYYPAAVKIFNQSYRVTCRENLVIDQPYSNGIWYDVGNVDAVFVNNWIEGALDGFFFEISKGAIVAGNVFVRCDKGVRALNSSNVQVYHNTFVDTVASFERTERSAVGDHFGWHPATGPDVDKREGHVFVGNLLVAEEGFRKPLARFEQTPVLCGRLTRPQVARLDANVYVRRVADAALPLLVWSPVSGETCQVDLQSLDALRAIDPRFEEHGRFVGNPSGAIFKSVELANYEPIIDVVGPMAGDTLPAPVRSLLGWPEAAARVPGAYSLPVPVDPASPRTLSGGPR
jgi:parallel beta-helix repeat protein